MAYVVHGGPDSGLQGRFCLRDPETRQCYRDADGRLVIFADALTAEAALPHVNKKAKAPVSAEVEPESEPVKAKKEK